MILLGTSEGLQNLVKKSVSTIDSSQDSWSDLVSGIAPLVLLVGERVTKQHLREALSKTDYYMLGATPFGLATSVVSLLRLVSLPVVGRLIGRSDELLKDICQEITPVNTGEVSSILESGKVQRGAAEKSEGTVSRLHVWAIDSAVNFDDFRARIQGIRQRLVQMTSAYKNSVHGIPSHTALTVAEFAKPTDPESAAERIESLYTNKAVEDEGTEPTVTGVTSVKVTAVGGELNYLDGIVRSEMANTTIVTTSIALILGVHVASLADARWKVSLAWVFVVAGYAGLLFSVGLYAEAVRHRISCSTVRFEPTPGTYCALQNAGIDKEGTLGFKRLSEKTGGLDVVKVCSLNHPSVQAQVLGTMAGGAFSASFLLHYLGLRSVQWWVSICELAICLWMVGVRTLSARMPIPFDGSDCMYDTDLRSTGVIGQSARNEPALSHYGFDRSHVQCFRAHFGTRNMGVKTQGDAAAALLASTIIRWDDNRRKALLAKIGFSHHRLARLPGQSQNDVPVYVLTHVGGTGLLSKEGIIRPAKPLVWAQEFTLRHISSQSLIGWVVNGLMRNEKLQLLPEFNNVVKQAVHVPASAPVLDWWLRSESMNTWESNCDNLQWAGALHLGVLLSEMVRSTEDQDMKKALNDLLEEVGTNPSQAAVAVAKDLEDAIIQALI